MLWERARKRGQLLYILVWGILIFGGAMLASDVCLGALYGRRPLLSSADGLQVAIDLLTGVLLGWLTWHSNEDRYHKSLTRASSANEITPEKIS